MILSITINVTVYKSVKEIYVLSFCDDRKRYFVSSDLIL